MERNIISSWIDRDPMLHLKRTGAYLKYVVRFWPTVFDTPLRDIDQFRMYLADKTRCTLSKREQVYAERCKEITYAVYAALVSEALDSAVPMNIEEIERQAEKLLQATPPFPIIIDLRTSPVSPALRHRVRFFRCGRAWIGVPKTAQNWAAFEQLPRTNEEAGERKGRHSPPFSATTARSAGSSGVEK